jgi:hypothetical protein
VFRTDQVGGLQSFIGVRGRHPNIGYDDVRLMRTNVTHQAVSVARLAYDLEAGVLEHPGHSRAEQGRVICETTRNGPSLPARSTTGVLTVAKMSSAACIESSWSARGSSGGWQGISARSVVPWPSGL